MFGARHGFRVCRGTRYRGGCIGEDDYKRDWLRERTLTWDNNINTISKTTGKYPHESYAAVVHAIQSEWIFLQRFARAIGDSFSPGEDDLGKLFASSFIRKDENPLPFHRISKYNAGQESRTGTPESSDVISGELLKLHVREHRIGTGRDGRGGLSDANHLWILSEEQRDRKEARDISYKSRIKGLVSGLKGTYKRLLLRAKGRGAWMSVRGTTVSGTVLFATEFRDFYALAITSLL